MDCIASWDEKNYDKLKRLNNNHKTSENKSSK